MATVLEKMLLKTDEELCDLIKMIGTRMMTIDERSLRLQQICEDLVKRIELLEKESK